MKSSTEQVCSRRLEIALAKYKQWEDVAILVASLSFQFPDIDALGTGFLIFNLILGFSDFTTPLTMLVFSRLPMPSEFVGVSAVH